MYKKWEIVFDYLMNLIKSNEISAGDLLTSQNRLKTRFNFSEQPIRIAFNKLIELKLVEVIPGKGFVVREKIKSNTLFSFRELYPNSKSIFYDFEEIIATKEISRITGYYPGTKLIKYKCRRIVNGDIMVYQESWLSTDIFNNFDIEYFKKIGFMKYIDEKTKVKVNHVVKDIYFTKDNDDINLKKFFKNNDVEQAIVDKGSMYGIYNELIEFRLSYYKPEDFKWKFIEWRN